MASSNSNKNINKMGFPARALKWMRGGLLAVNCSNEQFNKTIKSGLLSKRRIEAPKLCMGIDSGEWTIAECGIVSFAPHLLSKKLKSKAVHIYYDDTSGLVAYEIFDHGIPVERMTIQSSEYSEYLEPGNDDAADYCDQKTHLDFVSRGDRITFDSMLVEVKKVEAARKLSFINTRFSGLGISIPSSRRC
jgi:hypothetical protein